MDAEQKQEEQRLRRYFLWSVWIKGAISAAEILAGLFVLVVPPASITALIIKLAQNELSEDPGSIVASHVLPLAQSASLASAGFIAFYLASRGLIKLVLVLALLKDKIWAYPASLAVMGLFIVYQTIDIILTHSPIMIMVTLFDLVVVYFIWREFVVVREHLREKRRRALAL